MKTIRACKGCHMKLIHSTSCVLVILAPYAVEECPCQTCLIKINCTKQCKKYSGFMHTHLEYFYTYDPDTLEGFLKNRHKGFYK